MPNKMERFTQQSRRVLSLAEEEARQFQHAAIGPQHLLIALMREEGGIAGRVLHELGLNLTQLRELVEQTAIAQAYDETKRLDLSAEMKKVLELTVDEARQMGHHYIGTEHLLLGLVSQSESVAIEVLKRLNVSPEEVRSQTRKMMGTPPVDVERSSSQPVATSQLPGISTFFTVYAQEVIALTLMEAQLLQATSVGPEYLLLALLAHPGGLAKRALTEMGVEESAVRAEIAKLSENQNDQETVAHGLNESARKIVELAAEEKSLLGSYSIGTEHLLLGLIRQGESPAIDILKGLNVDLDVLRETTLRIVKENPPIPAPKVTTRTGEPRPSSGKMERFTQRARRVLSLAQEETERLQHSYIGTEHLLIGLMREEGGVAGRVLRDLGLDVHRVEELVERLTRAGQRTQNARLDLTPGTKKVLELAVDEARRMGHHYIGTEHLLLGLVRQSDGVAIDVLRRMNVSPEEVRRQTRRVLQESPLKARMAAKPTEPPQKAPRMRRFTPSVRRMLSQAQLEAERFQHQFIGVQHLLGALIREENGIAARVLRDKGVNPEAVDYLIKQVPPMQPYGGPLDLDENLKKVLELATEAAIIFDHYDIGVDDLLIGVARQPVGILLLRRLELDPQEIISATTELAAEYAPRPEQEGPDVVTSIEAELLDPPEPRQQTYVVPRQVELQRFAGEWRITLAIARAEAIRFKSKTIEPEHLLIALLIDEGDRTGKLLRAAGLDLQKLLAAIQLSEAMEPVIEVEMSPKMVEILGIATNASWKSQNYYIQVEHLLLGLLRQKENAAIDLLRQQNVSLEELEKAARESLG